MPYAKRACPHVGCPEITAGGPCDAHRDQADDRRGSARQRGYDSAWEHRRARYLRREENLFCLLCGGLANVADHHPLSRRQLLEQGVPDPDADHRLRPLCTSCHNAETARNQPGGWNAR